MRMTMNNLKATKFHRDGYYIFRSKKISSYVKELKQVFDDVYLSRFSNELSVNRNLIKRFADSIDVNKLFVMDELLQMVRMVGCRYPVYCGPVVSHFTSTDLTGNSYGLPWHQDFPSMASSNNAVIVWISVNDCSLETHSIAVAPGEHIHGILPGLQTDKGYILTDQSFKNNKVLNILMGDVLIFSPYLPHSTFVNPRSADYKLSFSRRFDDLDCQRWPKKGYANAYGVSVDRTLYTKTA
jgi:hypothetical protein